MEKDVLLERLSKTVKISSLVFALTTSLWIALSASVVILAVSSLLFIVSNIDATDALFTNAQLGYGSLVLVIIVIVVSVLVCVVITKLYRKLFFNMISEENFRGVEGVSIVELVFLILKVVRSFMSNEDPIILTIGFGVFVAICSIPVVVRIFTCQKLKSMDNDDTKNIE